MKTIGFLAKVYEILKKFIAPWKWMSIRRNFQLNIQLHDLIKTTFLKGLTSFSLQVPVSAIRVCLVFVLNMTWNFQHLNSKHRPELLLLLIAMLLQLIPIINRRITLLRRNFSACHSNSGEKILERFKCCRCGIIQILILHVSLGIFHHKPLWVQKISSFHDSYWTRFTN